MCACGPGYGGMVGPFRRHWACERPCVHAVGWAGSLGREVRASQHAVVCARLQLRNLCADSTLLLVFVVGHDWGALIAWYLCLFRPERVTALVNTSVAFMRRIMIRTGSGAVKATDYFNRAYGPTYYICRFQEPGVAEEEFAPAHARHIMRRVLCNRFTAGAAGKPESEDSPLLPWLTESDVDYFAAAFEKTGFTGAINYYRNMDRNWELAAPWADAKVQVPTKFIVGDEDLTYHYAGIQDYIHKGGFKSDVPLLEDVVVIPGAGHFIQQEKAQEVSEHIYDFIKKF